MQQKFISIPFLKWSISALLICCGYISSGQQPAYKNPALSIEQRTADLLQRLTTDEKISLLGNQSPSVDRLDIPTYNWWNEALHGVARNGIATVFPQATAMAATFNDSLIHAVATAVSTEARAKYNLAVTQNRRAMYMGLTFWTPNINIFRDPRWGRGQETYGEDPFLTSTMGIAYVKGLQGDDAAHLKAAACAKHYAVHSGPEAERDSFNAIVSERDLRETYMYSFHKLVNAGVESVMCAYNSINNEPCCTSESYLQNILFKEWNFGGHVVTDCGALNDVLNSHKAYPTKEETAAAAIKAGVDLECGSILQADVKAAMAQGLLTEKDIDSSLARIIHTEIKLGFFDDPKLNPYAGYGIDSVHNASHIALSKTTAEQAMVLLKNNGVLPLNKEKYTSYMVVGSNSSNLDAILGNYHGISENMVTFAEGIAKCAGPAAAVQYDQGCNFTDTVNFGGTWAAGLSDITIAVIGLTPLLEGEAGDAFLSSTRGDKENLSLPRSQIVYLKELRKSIKDKPLVVVITAGSDIDISEVEPYADAIILAWYPGEQAGNALGDILFGKVSPSGRLPVTFYNSITDLPPYRDYAMKGRTYRYYQGKVQYPFGFGLSYTTFGYNWVREPDNAYKLKDTIRFSVNVNNTGNYDGDEVVQAYIQYPDLPGMPLKELKAFKKISLVKGETKQVNLSVPVSELMKWDEAKHSWKLYAGKYAVVIGKNAKEALLTKAIDVN